jgi:dTDP-4-dehydrorhamnose reductase
MGEITSKVQVLVTGANGQLGSEFRALESEYSGIQFSFTDVDDLDITKREEVIAFLVQHKPTFVINCAAYTAVDRAEDDEPNAQKLNALAPMYLAEAAMQVDARVIHISTDYVFDGKTYIPYSESFPPSPNSIYGRTKYEGEQYILQSGVGMVIRTSWLYSIYGKNFVKTIAQKSMQSDTLSVVYDQVGTPTWANDLAQAILAIVQKGQSQFIPDVFHYSNEGLCSWYDLAVEINTFLGSGSKILPILSSEYPTKANRPPYSVLSKAKIKDKYDVNIPHWRESLIKCLNSLAL